MTKQDFIGIIFLLVSTISMSLILCMDRIYDIINEIQIKRIKKNKGKKIEKK